ncbi:response regulator [Vibrio hippocampi]
MTTKEVWNTLSVKQKIFVMLFLPTTLILYLAFRQVSALNTQLHDINKADQLSQYSQVLSELHTLSTEARLSSDKVDFSPVVSRLAVLTPQIFSANEQPQIEGLLSDFQDSVTSLSEAGDLYERIDYVDWQSESYQNILLAMEKTPFVALSPEVAGHLQALYQIEWLMFWAEEEIWAVQTLLTESVEQDLVIDIINQIEQLVTNQQLFVNRFIAINANASQVGLLLNTFTDPAFERSSEFRNQILVQESVKQLSDAQRTDGLASLEARLLLLDGVSNQIEKQLRDAMSSAISDFESQRIAFLAVVLILTACIIFIGVSLSHRIVSNLNLVLRFLDNADDQRQQSLIAQIKGRDELSRFAHEVERLTNERIEGEQKLVIAKEEAESAREKAVMASKAKSSFLANMSHEIRTPLNGVIGISEVLAETDLSAPQKDYVDTIETSSQLLLSLINDILDFSKIESGMLQINAHSTQIRETVYDIASVVAPKIKEKGLALHVDIDPDVPNRILVDDHRLRQVFMNFMSNAVKFTESGAVTLGIHYLGEADNIAKLQFEVIDSGIGIDKARQANIFEAFAQEDDTTTRQFGGTGLGLTISTQLIELMGGHIQLESEKGVGSRFFFELDVGIDRHDYQAVSPLQYDELVLVCADAVYQERVRRDLHYFNLKIDRVASSLEQAEVDDPSVKSILLVVESEQTVDMLGLRRLQQDKSNTKVCLIRQLGSTNQDFGSSISALVTYPLLGHRLYKAMEVCSQHFERMDPIEDQPQVVTTQELAKVLLVEDNAVNQKVASLHLKKIGCTFDVANNGQEAVQMFSDNSDYTLVLMDCMMPVMDGFVATQEIRKYEASNQKARTPIIALTASIIDDDIQLCFDSGMDDYVPKPFKADVLKEKILTAIEAKQASIEAKPLKRQQPHQQSEQKAQQESAVNSGNGVVTASHQGRILLVEDNLVNQKVASLHLQKAGFDYVIAGDGEQALQTYMADQNFDLILMDCMMPVKDGFGATEDIRRYEKQQALSPTPIIALTASVVDDDIQKCYDSGMDGYVPKPIRREKLLHEIRNLM